MATMTARTVSHTTEFKVAEQLSAPLLTRIFSILRIIYSLLHFQNPFIWSWTYGKRNPHADMEGPFYLLGAPSRMIDRGKGVLSTKDELKTFLPFLLRVRVLDPQGKPAANVSLDWWQSDGAGMYSFTTYNGRGKFITDADGCVEVLTVAPAPYGPAGHMRAAHIHILLFPAAGDGGKWDTLTTQLYLCPGNDRKALGSDFLNFVRQARHQNVLRAWCIPAAYGEKQYLELPVLPESDEMVKSVAWWNERLATHGGHKIVAGANMDIKLNTRSGWF